MSWKMAENYSGYCEGELRPCIESAVGAEYIGE
jgi:hypothetical protein